MSRLERTWKNHLEAFKQTYGLSTALAISVDVLTLSVGLALVQLDSGTVWTALGIALAVFSAGGLLKRAYAKVTA